MGAGLAGLCVAQALQAAGFDVQVYERDASAVARRQGYRITVDRHGLAALQACLPAHLFDLFLATSGSPGDRFYFLNARFQEAFRLRFKPDDGGHRLSQPRQADRATLRAVLLQGLERRVQFGKTVERIEETASDVGLEFTDGSAVRAEVVVGADSVGSVVRRHLLPTAAPVDTGYVALYGHTPLTPGGSFTWPEALERGGAIALGARGHVFFCTAMRFQNPPAQAFARAGVRQASPTDGDYVMWALVLPRTELPPEVTRLAPEVLHHSALRVAGAYHPLVGRLVSAGRPDFTLATPLLAGVAPAEWPRSRVALLGDAVHVMPPFGAHGGNTALRDAARLAHDLRAAASRGADLPETIQRFEQQMAAYAFREVGQARNMMRRSVEGTALVRWVLQHGLPGIRMLTGRPAFVHDLRG